MNNLGLTEERFNQLYEYYNGDMEEIEYIVNGWGAEIVNKGYDIFELPGMGDNMFHIEKIDEVGAFDSDIDAAKQAEKDGIKLIPVEELPENFYMRCKIWIDDPKVRDAINKYCNR